MNAVYILQVYPSALQIFSRAFKSNEQIQKRTICSKKKTAQSWILGFFRQSFPLGIQMSSLTRDQSDLYDIKCPDFFSLF